MPKDDRKWYKKKRYIIPTVLGTLLIAFSGDTQTQTSTSIAPVVKSYQEQATKINPFDKVVSPKTTNTYVPSEELSNDNHYTNTDGNTVHSPAYSNGVPSGASAQCRDGTYSFSQSRSGTCSHHGGVARWL